MGEGEDSGRGGREGEERGMDEEKEDMEESGEMEEREEEQEGDAENEELRTGKIRFSLDDKQTNANNNISTTTGTTTSATTTTTAGTTSTTTTTGSISSGICGSGTVGSIWASGEDVYLADICEEMKRKRLEMKQRRKMDKEIGSRNTEGEEEVVFETDMMVEQKEQQEEGKEQQTMEQLCLLSSGDVDVSSLNPEWAFGQFAGKKLTVQEDKPESEQLLRFQSSLARMTTQLHGFDIGKKELASERLDRLREEIPATTAAVRLWAEERASTTTSGGDIKVINVQADSEALRCGYDDVERCLQELVASDSDVRRELLHTTCASPILHDPFLLRGDESIDKLLRHFQSDCRRRGANQSAGSAHTLASTATTTTSPTPFYAFNPQVVPINGCRVEALLRRSEELAKLVGTAAKQTDQTGEEEESEETKHEDKENEGRDEPTTTTKTTKTTVPLQSVAARLRSLSRLLYFCDGLSSAQHLHALVQVMLAERRLLDGRSLSTIKNKNNELLLDIPNEWKPEVQVEELYHTVSPWDNTVGYFEQFSQSQDLSIIDGDVYHQLWQCTTALQAMPQRFQACKEAIEQTNQAIKQVVETIAVGRHRMEEAIACFDARLAS
eukprot:GHVS01076940.1.p1 GENE.GHVS01076940.1~~GHVS01076940.1.p1  ORF type:complete len:612 (+),score=164.50 GHVS01076940.1:79-1914(+)